MKTIFVYALLIKSILIANSNIVIFKCRYRQLSPPKNWCFWSPNGHSNWFCLRFQIVPTLRQFSIDFNSEFAAAVGQLDAVQQQKLAAALA